MRAIAAFVVVTTIGAAACTLFVDSGDLACSGEACGADAATAVDGASDASADAPAVVDAGGEDAMPPADGGRTTNGLIALYLFDEDAGTTVHDTSSYTPLLDLAIQPDGGTRWVADGLAIDTASLVKSAGPASKVSLRCKVTHEVTLEAWVTPANVTQTGRIAGVGAGPGTANVSIGGQGNSYVLYTSSVGLTGNPGTVTAGRTHIVATKGPGATRTLYVNGVVAASDGSGNDFADWDESDPMTIGAVSDGSYEWLGTIHLVAFYDRALTLGEIAANYGAGPR